MLATTTGDVASFSFASTASSSRATCPAGGRSCAQGDVQRWTRPITRERYGVHFSCQGW